PVGRPGLGAMQIGLCADEAIQELLARRARLHMRLDVPAPVGVEGRIVAGQVAAERLGRRALGHVGPPAHAGASRSATSCLSNFVTLYRAWKTEPTGRPSSRATSAGLRPSSAVAR